jgi:hypothetical protein
MAGPSADRITEWEGGSLSELVTVLESTALPVRIEVIAPGTTNSTAGEVHLLAGGLADAFAGSLRRDDAVAALQRLEGARFIVECRLPDPDSGSLSEAGPGAGSLADRPLASLMRYCEEYVLTCRLEVQRGEDHAVINYRRGEIISATVGGAEGSDRLPEVLAWTEGSYEIILPAPVLPHVPGRTRETIVARPSDRKRHPTLPLALATETKTAGAVTPDDKTTPIATTPHPAPRPQTTPAPVRAPTRSPAVPVAPLQPEMTTRGTPPVPPVPLQPAPTAARPTLQGPGVQPAPSAQLGKTPVPPQARPQASPTTTPSLAKSAKPAAAPAPAKPVAIAAPPVIAKPTQAPRPSQVAGPTPAAPVAAAQPANAAAAAPKTAQPPTTATPATAAQANSAPQPAPSHAKAATATSNDLMPASGTIEAKPKHASNLPPSTAPIQVAEQPGQPIVTTPAQPPAPAPSRPSEPRRQRVASRQKVRPHPLGAYVFVGLAIGIGIVLAYWAYWYLPFGHH